MLGTAFVVATMVLSVGANTILPFSGIIALYAGYRAYGKAVPSQGFGTCFYILAIVFGIGLQFNAVLGALLFGYATKRYAFWNEIEPTELEDDDPMYYLHEDSPDIYLGRTASRRRRTKICQT